MRPTVVRIVSIVLSSVVIAVLGLLLLWPKETTIVTLKLATLADRIERIPPDLFDRPPLTEAITLEGPAEAERRRERLRHFVFGTSGLPRGLPTVEEDVEDDRFTDELVNLDHIDRLTIELPLDFTSVAYHVIPERANGELLIYHNGHDQELEAGKRTVAHFLERGWTLLVFAMPYAGRNTNPESIEDTRCGRIEPAYAGRRAEHDALACLPRPLRYFLEPVAVGLNYASGLGYERTAMVGLSGGGWTTVAYAALDPRVERSYPVAGSHPSHIAARICRAQGRGTGKKCFGDIEHRLPAFYSIANYLELYTLGALGEGRRQLAIYNVYDRCCFSGRWHEGWRERVQAAVRRLGCGGYDAVGDATHRGHRISRWALQTIASDLAHAPARCR